MLSTVRFFCFACCIGIVSVGNAWASEETPSIFKETNCFADTIKIVKPKPLGLPIYPDPGGIGAPQPICLPSTAARTVPVSGNDALSRALSSAQCGDRIIASGNFSGNFALSRSCAATSVIVVTSEGGATFNGGTFSLNGSHTILTGMRFERGTVNFSGDHMRVSGNVFSNPQGDAIKGSGSSNRIDHNEISGASANGIEINLQGGAARNQSNLIDRNYIHDSRATGNGGESIRILTDLLGMAGTTIEYNLMERVSVPGEGEAISMKTGGNIVRGNTLLDSPNMGIVNRAANNNVFDGNFISGSKGLRIHGDNNIARNNVIRGGSFSIMAGDRVNDGSPKGLCPSGGEGCTHSAARNTVAENNSADIIVGYTFGPEKIPASSTRLANNCGSVSLRLQVGTQNTGGGCNQATLGRQLTRADTGPAALAADPQCE